jgi:hypothetical protein
MEEEYTWGESGGNEEPANPRSPVADELRRRAADIENPDYMRGAEASAQMMASAHYAQLLSVLPAEAQQELHALVEARAFKDSGDFYDYHARLVRDSGASAAPKAASAPSGPSAKAAADLRVLEEKAAENSLGRPASSGEPSPSEWKELEGLAAAVRTAPTRAPGSARPLRPQQTPKRRL